MSDWFAHLGFELKSSDFQNWSCFHDSPKDIDQGERLKDLLIQPIVQMGRGPEKSEGT